MAAGAPRRAFADSECRAGADHHIGGNELTLTMPVVLITGSAGLIGSEAVRFFADRGFDVAGIDNDMRRYFFGDDGSTNWRRASLQRDLPTYRHIDADIRDEAAIESTFAHYGRSIALVVHAAAQPSHDWAAREPLTDFTINANGTLIMLEMTRKHCPDAPFIFTSTNKVYGDTPNRLPLVERETRWTVEDSHPYAAHGIDESMSIDASMHSLFGASKVAADLLVQEYGRYFGMKTACFRCGCLTGPGHSGAELHGFLSFLVKCAVADRPYTVFGYKGKQVRDNIHSHDLVDAFWQFAQAPRSGEVYNIGGGPASNCSMLEAIAIVEHFTGRPMRWSYSEKSRAGDHIWWVSDIRKFRDHYPGWNVTRSVDRIIEEICREMSDRLSHAGGS
jgi:CDP-paratose 2-epimerase